MIVIIDNYDSFTYNLYQAVAVYAQDVIVLRNDAVDASMLQKLKPTALVFSPGAGHPHAAGNMESIIQQCYRDIPMLGICLGHQAIGEAFGAKLTNLSEVYHGVATPCTQFGNDVIFDGLDKRIEIGRYHSWVVDRSGFPDCLDVTAVSDDGCIMGLKHKNYDIHGIQFHPESVLTPDGKKMVRNWLEKA